MALPRLTWTTEEMILAAALAEELGWRGVNATTRGVRELSTLLQSANFYPRELRDEKFRSANSVSRKINNLRASHPDSNDGVGLRNSPSELPIVQAFVDDPDGMTEIAREIRSSILDGSAYRGMAKGQLQQQDAMSQGADALVQSKLPLVEAMEGDIAELIFRRRERSPKLREAKLTSIRQAGLALECEVCGFNFGEAYGKHGDGYIEVHHRIPLHVSGATLTSLDDLALLCANCHRMVHRKSPWLSVDGLRRIFRAD